MAEVESGKPALPRAWILPIRLFIYLVLAGCSGYIYFNIGNLEITHYLVILSIVVVSAMVLLDCRVSDDYWKRHDQQHNSDDN